MAYAPSVYVYGKSTGGLTISEGDAPATYFLPDPTLPTLWYWDDDDLRKEVLLPKGCVLTLTDVEDGASVPYVTYCTKSTQPIGIAQYHLLRPFDKGTSQGVGWIRKGYLKYPFVPGYLIPGDIDDGGSPAVVFNDAIHPTDYVMSDAMGRLTKWVEWDTTHAAYGYSTTKIVGQVIDVQKFGVTYDTQNLEYLKYETEEFQEDFHTLVSAATTAGRPFGATADYIAMFETGAGANTYAGELGIDDALDRYASQGMITVVLMLQ